VSSSIKVLPFAYVVGFVDRSTDTILATRFRWIRLKNTTFLRDGCHLKRKKQRQTVRFFSNNSISQKGSLNRHGGMSVGPGDRVP